MFPMIHTTPLTSLILVTTIVRPSCPQILDTVSVCPPGFLNPPNCSLSCPPRSFGQNCSFLCSPNCLDWICNASTGRCSRCSRGFVGDGCLQKCPHGFYGQDCALQCSRTCVDRDCDVHTGFCAGCVPGFTGRTCNILFPGKEENPSKSSGITTHEEDEDETAEKYASLAIFLVIVIVLISLLCVYCTLLQFLRSHPKVEKLLRILLPCKRGDDYTTSYSIYNPRDNSSRNRELNSVDSSSDIWYRKFPRFPPSKSHAAPEVPSICSQFDSNSIDAGFSSMLLSNYYLDHEQPSGNTSNETKRNKERENASPQSVVSLGGICGTGLRQNKNPVYRGSCRGMNGFEEIRKRDEGSHWTPTSRENDFQITLSDSVPRDEQGNKCPDQLPPEAVKDQVQANIKPMISTGFPRNNGTLSGNAASVVDMESGRAPVYGNTTTPLSMTMQQHWLPGLVRQANSGVQQFFCRVKTLRAVLRVRDIPTVRATTAATAVAASKPENPPVGQVSRSLENSEEEESGLQDSQSYGEVSCDIPSECAVSNKTSIRHKKDDAVGGKVLIPISGVKSTSSDQLTKLLQPPGTSGKDRLVISQGENNIDNEDDDSSYLDENEINDQMRGGSAKPQSANMYPPPPPDNETLPPQRPGLKIEMDFETRQILFEHLLKDVRGQTNEMADTAFRVTGTPGVVRCGHHHHTVDNMFFPGACNTIGDECDVAAVKSDPNISQSEEDGRKRMKKRGQGRGKDGVVYDQYSVDVETPCVRSLRMCSRNSSPPHDCVKSHSASSIDSKTAGQRQCHTRALYRQNPDTVEDLDLFIANSMASSNFDKEMSINCNQPLKYQYYPAKLTPPKPLKGLVSLPTSPKKCISNLPAVNVGPVVTATDNSRRSSRNVLSMNDMVHVLGHFSLDKKPETRIPDEATNCSAKRLETAQKKNTRLATGFSEASDDDSSSPISGIPLKSKYVGTRDKQKTMSCNKKNRGNHSTSSSSSSSSSSSNSSSSSDSSSRDSSSSSSISKSTDQQNSRGTFPGKAKHTTSQTKKVRIEDNSLNTLEDSSTSSSEGNYVDTAPSSELDESSGAYSYTPRLRNPFESKTPCTLSNEFKTNVKEEILTECVTKSRSILKGSQNHNSEFKKGDSVEQTSCPSSVIHLENSESETDTSGRDVESTSNCIQLSSPEKDTDVQKTFHVIFVPLVKSKPQDENHGRPGDNLGKNSEPNAETVAIPYTEPDESSSSKYNSTLEPSENVNHHKLVTFKNYTVSHETPDFESRPTVMTHQCFPTAKTGKETSDYNIYTLDPRPRKFSEVSFRPAVTKSDQQSDLSTLLCRTDCPPLRSVLENDIASGRGYVTPKMDATTPGSLNDAENSRTAATALSTTVCRPRARSMDDTSRSSIEISSFDSSDQDTELYSATSQPLERSLKDIRPSANMKSKSTRSKVRYRKPKVEEDGGKTRQVNSTSKKFLKQVLFKPRFGSP